jgi:flagellar hook-associated protein 2
MSTSSVSSLLSSLTGTSSTESLSQLLGQTSSTSSGNSSSNEAIQSAVNSILNSATNTSGSGINVTSTVDAILQIDAAPEVTLNAQVDALNTQTSSLQGLQSSITAFQTSLQALTDFTGDFGGLSVSSSNNSVVSATAANGTVVGPHTITVTKLATTSAEYSVAFATATTTLATGSFDLKVGTNDAVTIPVDSADGTDTLNGLVSYINNKNLGVTASAITDSSGTRLALESQTSGTAGQITLSNDTTGAKGGGMAFTDAVDGKDASLTVDGIPIDSASNTVTGVISGVTLTLSGVTASASGGTGSPVTLQISPNLTPIATDINNLVSNWNTLITAINSGIQSNSSTGSSGAFAGDTSVDFVQQQLLTAISSSMSGNSGLVNLQSIGIEMQNDGTLTVDSTTLNSALQNNFSVVQDLFQSTSGVGRSIQSSLTSLTNPTTGALYVDMNGISSQVNDLKSQISDFQLQLQQTQTQLLAEYSTINTTLEQLPQMLASINSQLSALNPSKSS